MIDGDDFERTVMLGQESAGGATLQAIVVIDGTALTYSLPDSGEVRIGRFTGSGLVIDHDTLSRMHAILRPGPTMTLEDLGSANGTYVREVRIKPGQQVRVAIGDLVRFGDVFVILY